MINAIFSCSAWLGVLYFKFSCRSVVKEFFNLSDTMMRYFTKVGLFGKKSSDLTNSIFDGPFILAYGVLAYHQGHFNIPYAFPGLNNSGSVLYGDSTGDHTPRIVIETSLTPSMPMAFGRLALGISSAVTNC